MVQAAAYIDTICAPATGVGGAVAMVRVSGPAALAACDALVRFRTGTACGSAAGRVKYGEALCADGSVLDQVVVSVFRAPNSYTGEDVVEICCHASPYVVSSVLERLCSIGVRMAEPGEFTRRAFLSGKMDLAQAEAVADLIAAQSEAAHRVALNQLKGGYSEQLRALRGQLLELSALLELELDFSEEDVEFASRQRLSELLTESIGKVSVLCESFRVGNAVKNGVPVAIVGAPNSGKSTLLNHLVGADRAIVSSVAGTTRDTVEETMVLGGILYRFIDTAGIRHTTDYVEGLGVERSLEAVRHASIIICLVDGTTGDMSVLDGLRPEPWQTLIVAVNKADACESDLCSGTTLSTSIAADGRLDAFPIGTPLSISALTGIGIDTLKEAINTAGTQMLTLALPDSHPGSGTPAGIVAGSGSPAGLVTNASFGSTLVTNASFGSTLVTNARHAEALRRSLASLEAVRSGLSAGLPSDLVAEDLRSAVSFLGEITGEITTSDILGSIFSRFCIGK